MIQKPEVKIYPCSSNNGQFKQFTNALRQLCQCQLSIVNRYEIKSNHFISGNKAHRQQHNSQADSQKPTETHKHTKITNKLICSWYKNV